MTITIDCSPAQVWEVLTDVSLMPQWMGPDMDIHVSTDWVLHAPIVIRGFHHGAFENKGTIVQFEKERQLSYTHLSDVSQLEDIPENYTTISFTLTPQDGQTILTIRLDHFPTVVIQKHLEFYWRGTLYKIREFIYSRTSA